MMTLLLVQTLFQIHFFEAGRVEMKENQVVMHSGVTLKQQFGSLRADRIEGEMDKGSKPLHLRCHGNVELSVNEGGLLKTPFAAIDCTAHLAECFSQDGALVVFEDPQSDYRLVSEKVQAQFLETAPWIERVTAEGNVECLSTKGDSLKGSRAELERSSEGGLTHLKLQGPCLLRTASGEEVAASSAEINLAQKVATLKGKTVLSIYGEDPRTVRAFGEVKVYKDRLLIDSPEEGGVVPEALQAHLEDKRGDIFADRVELIYKEGSPEKLILTGNVRLEYHSHYALADRGEVDFGKRELILEAKERKAVLFYDQLNKMQASAPKMKLTIGSQNDQIKAEGIGTMRLQFKEEEYQEFKKRFLINGF